MFSIIQATCQGMCLMQFEKYQCVMFFELYCAWRYMTGKKNTHFRLQLYELLSATTAIISEVSHIPGRYCQIIEK